jgi:hypothetical protein
LNRIIRPVSENGPGFSGSTKFRHGTLANRDYVILSIAVSFARLCCCWEKSGWIMISVGGLKDIGPSDWTAFCLNSISFFSFFSFYYFAFIQNGNKREGVELGGTHNCSNKRAYAFVRMKLMKRRRKKLAHFGPFVGKCFSTRWDSKPND